jgi:Skp family chaperone for outer membrane proteins
VKRKFGFITGIAALALAAYVGSRLSAQGAGAAPALQTKVAVVNLPMVIKNYEKYKHYEDQLRDFAKGFQTEDEKLKGNLLRIQNNTTMSAEDKEQEGKKYTREREDLAMKFKKELAKKQEEQLVTLYQEVEDMVKRVAMANNFEMVLQYSDSPDPKDRNAPINILRKVQGGVCGPMYAAAGLDISKLVYDNLNWYYKNPPKAGSAH